MSEHDRPEQPASPPIDDAVDVALGPLLRDRDVTEVHCLEGGFLQVIRRGRRERIDAVLEGPLFALAREEGGERELLTRKLRGGHRLVVGPCVDGRQSLRVIKAAALDVELDALVEEQLLPPGLPDELAAATALGGVLVLGPSRAGRQRVAAAVARGAQRILAIAALGDNVAALFPAPAGGDVAARARAADALGFDALFALELTAQECASLVRAPLALPLIASVRASTMDVLASCMGDAPHGALAPLACVVGVGPDGRPRLLEVHGAVGQHVDGAGRQRSGPPEPAPGRWSPTPSGGAQEAPQVAALPAGWASDEPDVDPGWELAGLPQDAPPSPAPGAGSFDDALARQASRPSFQPSAPRPHPQAARLKGAGNPFGGLTFEPPPAPPIAADGAAGDADSDEEPR